MRKPAVLITGASGEIGHGQHQQCQDDQEGEEAEHILACRHLVEPAGHLTQLLVGHRLEVRLEGRDVGSLLLEPLLAASLAEAENLLQAAVGGGRHRIERSGWEKA